MVKVAYATSDGAVVDQHFGRCDRFDVYDVTAGRATSLGSRIPRAIADAGVSELTDARVELLTDCAILSVTSVGGPAAARITNAGIHPITVVPGTSIAELNSRLRKVLASKPPPWLRRIARDDPEVLTKIFDHPCFSQNAQHRYARMHLPVAPGCNVQCDYCDRRFDCPNESRPGLTTRLLTPDLALARVRRVVSRVPQLRVVGVAGPGEPLANASRTFRTFELVRRYFPELRLCLSTNGLALLDHVERIVSLGIEHVTITINMTDPEIGAGIYSWVAFRGRRYTGAAGARILGERQLDGLRALVGRGVVCKVNSVLIPGINDDHLVEVSQTVRRLGAFTHNVMPLLVGADRGTRYGHVGQREPSAHELERARRRCERAGDGSMTVMRHCRQCRADAIGQLGEDRSAEFDEGERLAPEVCRR